MRLIVTLTKSESYDTIETRKDERPFDQKTVYTPPMGWSISQVEIANNGQE